MTKGTLHPPNKYNSADGFYCGEDCLACDAPCATAPDNIGYAEDETCRTCYVKRQPENDDELERMIDAMQGSCVENIHYGGSDPKILARFEARRPVLPAWIRACWPPAIWLRFKNFFTR